MHVVVLQHMDSGHPWYLRELLAASGVSWSPLRLDRGDALPRVDRCDAVWAMGGALQVWQEEEHPWLAAEKRFIRQVVEAGVPFLGVCLGHQLLASALGGAVGLAERAEVGLFPVVLTPEGESSPWLVGCETGARLQWHEAEVTRVPAGARVLARSDRCPVQAMVVGDSAVSLQYHVEADAPMLATWCESENARAKLDKVFGGDGLSRFQRAALAELPDLKKHARAVFGNWMKRVAPDWVTPGLAAR